jgi:hypothetical protein
MDEKITKLLTTLPPIVACITWDVLNDQITAKTIELADQVTEEEWEEYDIIRCIAAGNPAYPPTLEAQVLVEMMLESMEQQAV